MTRRFLVPTDGSEQARRAFEHAVELFPAAEITALHVVDPVQAGYGGAADDAGHASGWRETEGTDAEATFEAVRDIAADAGVTLNTRIVEGRPAEAIVAFAEEDGFDGIVMGSRGRSGVSRVLLGSVADTVVRRSPVPVTVVR